MTTHLTGRKHSFCLLSESWVGPFWDWEEVQSVSTRCCMAPAALKGSPFNLPPTWACPTSRPPVAAARDVSQ